jgi:iron complex outermembrane receptor protein
MRFSRTLSVVSAVLGATAAHNAMAQQPESGAPSGGEGAVLEEVVVTAEKRETSLQNTPIAITVVSGAQLAQAGVTDLQQLSKVAPDLDYVRNTIFTQFSIRGVASQDIGELGDSAVTVGIDGEYLNRPVALNGSLFDIDRIEVLRGPQGTLYGRNATAGAINIVTSKPGHEFGANLSVDAGNFSALNTRGMVNIPLGDKYALRGAFMTAKHDGYTNNAPAGRGDDQDVKAGRLSLGFDPTEALTGYVSLEYVDVDQAAPSQWGVPVTSPVGQSPTAFNPDFPDDFPLGDIGFFQSKQKAARGQITYHFGPADLTYVGGYRDNDTHARQPLNGFVPAVFSFDNDHLDYRTQSHELRLSGNPQNPLVWQAGLFYSDETSDVQRGLFLPIAGGSYINFFLLDVESKSRAVFGQATYKISDTLSVTGGLRSTHDQKSRVGASFGGPNLAGFRYPSHPTDVSAGAPDNGAGDWDKTTWLADVDWRFATDKMLYAKVSTGYKAGGFDNVGRYDPETLTAYEIGSKNRFLDQRLQLNAAAFYYDYKDQQTSVFISTTVGNAVQNAGSSKVKGLELDLEALVTENDRARFVVNYLDTRYDQLLTTRNVVGADSVPVDLAGNEAPQAPKWTLVAGYDHTWHLLGGQLTASLDSRYKSDYFLTAFNWEADRQKAHTITNFQLGYTSPDSRWDVAAYVQNIENERTLTYSAFNGSTINIYNFIFGPPRTYGGRFTYRW